MPQALHTILVAIDDSPSSDSALTEAIALAKASGAELVLAHVTTIRANGGGSPRRVPDAASTPLVAAHARALEAGVRSTTELLLGYPPKQIALVAEDRDADLVVIGTRNLKGFKRAVAGSTSAELLKQSSRPILVVSTAGRATAAAA